MGKQAAAPPQGRVDASRLLHRLDALATIGAGRDGITRLAWSPEEREAASVVAGWMADTGASVQLDSVGNVIADCPGDVPGVPPIAIGSHLDTVVGGGPLDGTYGVVAGIEALARLAETDTRLRHPLRVVAWANEEGVVAPAFTGSRAAVGALDPAELRHPGPDGVALGERMIHAGCQPDLLAIARWSGRVAAAVELHVEQGLVLEEKAATVGVVTGITAQRRGVIRVIGEANHAGTTPMAARRDALAAAARAVLAVQALAIEGPVDVATVGRLEAHPGVVNVVPGEVELSFDLRAADDGRAAAGVVALLEAVDRIREDTRTAISFRAFPVTAAVRTDPLLRGLVAEAADARGLPWCELPSGAGHDVAVLAPLGPVGMIFVPSTGGRSHCGQEHTPPDSLVAGADVLFDVLLRADRRLDA